MTTRALKSSFALKHPFAIGVGLSFNKIKISKYKCALSENIFRVFEISFCGNCYNANVNSNFDSLE